MTTQPFNAAFDTAPADEASYEPWIAAASLATPMRRAVGGVIDAAAYALSVQAMQAFFGADTLSLVALSVAPFLVIQLVLVAARAQSIGMLALGMRVARRSDWCATPSKGALIGREILALLPLAIPVVSLAVHTVNFVLIFMEGHRALHDRLTGTQVVVRP